MPSSCSVVGRRRPVELALLPQLDFKSEWIGNPNCMSINYGGFKEKKLKKFLANPPLQPGSLEFRLTLFILGFRVG